MTDLSRRPFWVFDMDGTLTLPAHDFEAFKAEHGLPPERDLLGATLGLSEPRRSQVLHAIRLWEDGIARAARAQEDALLLLGALSRRGARLAVLTRNSKEGATVTLEASGLARFFPDDELILGRGCAPAKPEPDGVELLLSRAGFDADDAVMVGDWVHDVMAGRRAGTATVLVQRHGPIPDAWRPWSDVVVDRLDALIA